YLEDWRRVSEELTGDLEAAVNARVATLEAEFNDEFLEAVVKAGGLVEMARTRAGKGTTT
ncbi:MAG: hypothetical protein OEX74_14955, partial [Gammaproteobacteria bacterium]|nr:hypothetical protein [Gammaproteobacteria bacterium]